MYRVCGYSYMYIDLISKCLTLKEADAIEKQKDELLKKQVIIDLKRSAWNFIDFFMKERPETELCDKIEIQDQTLNTIKITQ